MDYQNDGFDNIKEQAVGVFVQQEASDQQFLTSVNYYEPRAKRQHRPNIDRGIGQGAAQIFQESILCRNPTYSERQFRRRFRMSSRLCKKIISDIKVKDPSFLQLCNAAGKKGASEYQKMTAALRLSLPGGRFCWHLMVLKVCEC